MRVRKDYGGPTMTIEQAHHRLSQREEVEEEDDQLSISQLRPTKDRLEPAKSIIPLATVDPKRKVPETPSSELKKSKLVKASEGEPKKTKPMGSTIFAARIVEV